ncbi:general substrate transporter [Pseudovirgaria hyperparasitica]|uniref:General substrate transporter n=1 Tax=Pseudovirgaria hyperparasitica TaxID=470096 RepID=A0A6A6W485_9PEZI|nr:general substrate transporter [Pseudovirgaria hyperparasitica]KAF2756377.1 general substrate transporter [Pseudovirgaria hyperparasitica]
MVEAKETATEVRAVSDTGSLHKNAVEIKVITGTEALAEARIKEPPQLLGFHAFVLYLCAFVGFFCSTCNGFDGSMFNSLLTNKQFKEYYGVENTGAWTGIVTSMYQIGGVVALPFIGPACDRFGRRYGMMIGGLIASLGVIIQSTTKPNHNPVGQFMGGRFLLGFAVPIITTAGPLHVVETAHPSHRGVVTGLYNTFWFVGSILAAGSTRGSSNLSGNKTWMVPVWLQILFPGLILALAWFLPESPRWLYTRGRKEDAKKMLTYYHGNKNPDSIWVSLQLREYDQYLEMDGADKRWWDYRILFKTRASRYRMLSNICIAVFGQWAGNGAISYFISGVLDTAGITGEIQQMNINLGLACMQFAFAVFGATMVDKLGRRPMLLIANIGASFIWIAAIVSVSINDRTGTASSSKAFLAFIFMFNAIFAFGMTPLQALYPVEVLSFEMRAKGMAFSNMSLTVAMLINQFAYPIALEQVKWKLYILFAVWCPVQALVIWLFIPETKNRTLEELDDIFNSPNPRNASLVKTKVALDERKNVVEVEKM